MSSCRATNANPACLACLASDAATVEACARAAYEAEHGSQPRYLWTTPDGSDYAMRPDTKERYRAIARAVLAAAARGGK